MIVWSGFGIIVPIVIFICGWVNSLFFTNTTLGNPGFMAATLLSAAVLVGVIGLAMDKPAEDGGEGGGSGHTFFWLKVKWWGAILAAGGAYMLVNALF